MATEIFDLRGNPTQNALIEDALTHIDFPWERLLPGMMLQTQRTRIPVEFTDLNRYAVSDDKPVDSHSHHITDGFDSAHVLFGPATALEEHDHDARHAALGLAWYSGKISLEQTMTPELTREVFAAEVAHMVDFFYLDADQRAAIFQLYHGTEVSAHEHGWFEETGNNEYWSWVGESFMAGFTYAFSDIAPVGADWFDHPSLPEYGPRIRSIVLKEVVTEEPPTPPIEPEPPMPPEPPIEPPVVEPDDIDIAPRPFVDLSASGVLWAINRVLFHPRGYAFTIQVDEAGNATGWYIQGDGEEVWTMPEDQEDALHAAFEATLQQSVS